jgi:enoyl-[acyl-carrier protein] reductase III
MAHDLKPGHIALVTGGSRGIGRATAIELARNGAATIYLNFLQNENAAAESVREIESVGAECVPVRANLAYTEQCEDLCRTIIDRSGHLDYLVHCAALTTFKPLHTIKPSHWDLTMNINARALVTLAQLLAPVMRDAAIVAISSLGSTRALESYGAMGPTKAALESIVRYLAMELGPQGIRVNGVVGGIVDTESIGHFPQARQMIEASIARLPARRIGTPADIAHAVLFLLGSGASWIHGENIVVDGGHSIL